MIDKMIKWHSGSTNFKKAFVKSFELLRGSFDDFANSKLIFFTDGYSQTPKKEISSFMDFLG